jgi:hypothetical protein
MKNNASAGEQMPAEAFFNSACLTLNLAVYVVEYLP